MSSSYFWYEAIIPVYFVYGLAFYSLGLALLIESGRSSGLSLARAIRFLAGFGLIHGTHEWLDMLKQALLVYYDQTFPLWLNWVQLALLVTSFILLMAFGQLLCQLRHEETPCELIFIAVAIFGIAAVGARLVYQLNDLDWILASSALARLTIGVPASIVACISLWRQRQIFREQHMDVFVDDLTVASMSIALYGVLGQIFVPKTAVFPGNLINSALFLDTLGFPVQILRSMFAVMVAISMIRVLRALEVENQYRLQSIEREKLEAERRAHEELTRLNEALQIAYDQKEQLLTEVRRREATRGVLLKRITAAQEAERQRIARELHDETGQALTGLTMGMRGVASKLEKLDFNTEAGYLRLLEKTASDALSELRVMINDLRPPQLDDMGLHSALRWMVERHDQLLPNLDIELEKRGEPFSLPPEVETTLFRIAQEGLNNVIKHADAERAGICIDYSANLLRMRVWDDGAGFNPAVALEPNTQRTAWGILGMQERASLINATLSIDSKPGHGTTLLLELALQDRKVTAL